MRLPPRSACRRKSCGRASRICPSSTRCSASAAAASASAIPEITEMQARAIFEAALNTGKETGKPVKVEIMVPLVAYRREFEIVREIIVNVARMVEAERRATLDYSIGTMIELPRAALKAGEISRGRGRRAVLLLRHQRSHADDAGPQRATTPRRSSSLHGQEGVHGGSLRVDRRRRGRRAHPHRAPSAGGRPSPASRSASAASTAASRGRSRSSRRWGSTTCRARPIRVPIARLAAAQAAIRRKRGGSAASTD